MYFRGDTRDFRFRRRTLNVRRHKDYCRHRLSDRENARGQCITLRQQKLTKIVIHGSTTIDWNEWAHDRRVFLNYVFWNAYKVDPRMDHFPWVENCSWPNSNRTPLNGWSRFTTIIEDCDRRRCDRSFDSFHWKAPMTVRKRPTGRWQSSMFSDRKIHTMHWKFIDKNINSLSSYTSTNGISAREGRKQGNDLFSLLSLRPFVSFNSHARTEYNTLRLATVLFGATITRVYVSNV